MAGTSSSIFNSDSAEVRTLGRFLRNGTWFVPLVLLIGAFNALVDPAHLFDLNSYEGGIGLLLAKGYAVANVSNYNERLVQKSYVEHLESRNDWLVLGSSRALQIGRDVLGARLEKSCTFHNSSVSAASLQDLIAIYGLYRERGLLPQTLIIGIDPWLFNKNLEANGYLPLAREYRQMEGLLEGCPRSKFMLAQDDIRFKALGIFQLVSPSYFQSSLEYLWKGKKQLTRDYHPLSEFHEEDESVILADGSLSYEKKFRTREPKEVEKDAIDYAEAEKVYNLAYFTQINPELRHRFEDWIRLIRSDGVNPVLFLAPYHPAVYPRLLKRRDTHAIAEVENYIRDFSQRIGIEVAGSYDPGMDFESQLFFDGMHPKPEVVSRIFSRLQIRCTALRE